MIQIISLFCFSLRPVIEWATGREWQEHGDIGGAIGTYCTRILCICYTIAITFIALYHFVPINFTSTKKFPRFCYVVSKMDFLVKYFLDRVGIVFLYSM